jgi:cytidyltransferase-like protein
MNSPKQIVVSGFFDDIKVRDLRFLEEAAKQGSLSVLLFSDETIRRVTGKAPKFPFAERNYFLNAVRYVGRVLKAEDTLAVDHLPAQLRADVWADLEMPSNSARARFACKQGIAYAILTADQLKGFPVPPLTEGEWRKVVVTGSFDWFHSGHVRFLEEVSTYGELHVIVGHDANICLLKGEGHPLLSQEERRYVVGSIKYVKQALISSGDGWLDADPEIKKLKPTIYAVNEDGDKGGKRRYCEENGIEYLVLKRVPAPGLPKRSSTDLRGF